MHGVRVLALAVTLLVTGCGRQLPARVDPPTREEAAIGVAYGVTVYCSTPIRIGGAWWSFDEPTGHWPPDMDIPPFPFSIWADAPSSYAVPGIVTLATPTTAVFRADADGSEFALVGHEENPTPGTACL
jgi:hypothetical protein